MFALCNTSKMCVKQHTVFPRGIFSQTVQCTTQPMTHTMHKNLVVACLIYFLHPSFCIYLLPICDILHSVLVLRMHQIFRAKVFINRLNALLRRFYILLSSSFWEYLPKGQMFQNEWFEYLGDILALGSVFGHMGGHFGAR